MALDDDTIKKVEEQFSKLTQQIFKTNRAQKSSIETILRGTRSRKEQQRIIDQYKKQLKEQIALLDDTNDEHKERIALYKKEIRETSKLNVVYGVLGGAVNFVAKVFLGFGKAVINTTKMFMDAGKETKTFSQATQHITTELGFASGATEKFFQSLDFNIENFRTLSKQGADFGQSLFGLRKAAHSANMPIMDFVDMMATNTQTFAKFFGTTQSGMPAIAEMARGMRDFTRDELSRFGLTFDDTNEYMTTYIDLMRSQGRAETMSTTQLLKGSQEYAKQLVRLSKITGQSTDELNAQIEQQKQNGVLAAALAKKSPEEAKRLNELVASLGGAQTAAGGLAVDMIAAGTPITELSRKLAGTNNSMLTAIEQFINNPATDIEETMSKMRTSANQMLKDFPQAAAYFQGEFVDILSNAATLAGKETAGKVGDEMAKVFGPESDFTKEAMKTKDVFDRISVVGEKVVTRLYTGPDSLAVASEKLATIHTTLYNAAKTVSTWLDNEEKPKTLKEVFKDIKTKMIESVKESFKQGWKNVKEVIEKMKTMIHNQLIKTYNSIMAKIPEWLGGTPKTVEDKADKSEREYKQMLIDEHGTKHGTRKFNQWKKKQPDTKDVKNKLYHNIVTGDSVYDQRKMLENQARIDAWRDAKKDSAFLDERWLGTTGATNLFSEPVTKKLTVHQGEKVLNQAETADYKSGMGKAIQEGSSGNAELIAGVERMITTNEKVANALNNLITIGRMTERNTKNLNNNVANLSGSLV
jgi:hypothetical protein